MADQNDSQNPPAPVQAPPAVTPEQTPATVVVAAAQTVAATGFKAVLKDLWNKFGVLFIIVGVLLIVAKFGDLVMDILGWSSKRTVEKAKAEDTQLKAQEDAANQQANALVKEANELPSKEGQVSDDWYKKKGN